MTLTRPSNGQTIDAAHIDQFYDLENGGQRLDVAAIYGGPGLANDATNVQSAMNAVGAAGGGEVFLRSGTWNWGTTVQFNYDSVMVRGAGWSTMLQPTAGFSGDFFFSPNIGVGVWRIRIGIRDLFINSNRSTQVSGNGIHNWLVRESLFHNIGMIGIHDYGIFQEGAADGNVSYDNRWDHIWMDQCGGGVNAFACENDRWVELTLQNLQPGYYMMTFAGGGQWISGCNLGSGVAAANNPAINLNNNSTSRIIGNRFDACSGPAVQCNSGNQIIANNEFIGIGNVAPNTVAAIVLNSTYNLIEGNQFYLSAGGAQPYTYAIQEVAAGASDYNLIVNNQLQPGQTGTVSLIGAHTKLMNNRPYNPLGVAAISVTASPFTYTNNDHVSEYVTISGGTVSSVAKNSTTLYSTTNVGIWLEPAEAVVVTYSVAPTMRADRK